MRTLLALASVALLVVSATPSTAAAPEAESEAKGTVARTADRHRASVHRRHRHARLHHRRQWRGYWPYGVVITAGHPLHQFRGEIVYTYGPPSCCGR